MEDKTLSSLLENDFMEEENILRQLENDLVLRDSDPQMGETEIEDFLNDMGFEPFSPSPSIASESTTEELDECEHTGQNTKFTATATSSCSCSCSCEPTLMNYRSLVDFETELDELDSLYHLQDTRSSSMIDSETEESCHSCLLIDDDDESYLESPVIVEDLEVSENGSEPEPGTSSTRNKRKSTCDVNQRVDDEMEIDNSPTVNELEDQPNHSLEPRLVKRARSGLIQKPKPLLHNEVLREGNTGSYSSDVNANANESRSLIVEPPTESVVDNLTRVRDLLALTSNQCDQSQHSTISSGSVSDQDFQRAVPILAEIKKKIRDVDAWLHHSHEVPINMPNQPVVPNGFPNLPAKSVQELINVEEALKKFEIEVRNNFVRFLTVSDETDLMPTMSKVCSKLVTDATAALFTYNGKNNNGNNFGDLKNICDFIIAAVRNLFPNELLTRETTKITFVKWLNLVKDRQRKRKTRARKLTNAQNR